MGMGYGANSAWIITEEKLAELNLPTWERFKQALKNVEERDDYTYHDFVNNSLDVRDYPEEDLISLVTSWEELKLNFQEATGLELGILYHDCDAEGSRYDDVDGIVYTVDDVITFTPAGSKAYNEGLIEEASWVTFG